MLAFSRAGALAMPHVPMYTQRSPRLDSPREFALYALMECLDRFGVTYELPVEKRGVEELVTANKSGRAVVVLSVHQTLSLLILRLLHDEGIAPAVVAARDHYYPPGAGVARSAVTMTGSLFLRLRRELGRSGIVCAMVDSGDVNLRPVAVRGGQINVSASWLELTRRSEAEMFLVSGTLTGETVELVVRRTNGSIEELAAFAYEHWRARAEDRAND